MAITARTRLIFSDVDGTLLDARYEHPFTMPVLHRALALGQLVLVSGRTLSELVALSQELGRTPDLIGENGAFIATRDEQIADVLSASGAIVRDERGYHVAALAAPRAVARARVRAVLHPTGEQPVVADELPPKMFAQLSGYDVASAIRAVNRDHSVLLHDADSRTRARLRAAGLEAHFGGRWLTVIAGSSKGRAVRTYRTISERLYGPAPSVAIGDAGNDESMLSAVDRAFVVQRAGEGHSLSLSMIPGAQLLTRPGNAGWIEMIELLEREALTDA